MRLGSENNRDFVRALDAAVAALGVLGVIAAGMAIWAWRSGDGDWVQMGRMSPPFSFPEAMGIGLAGLGLIAVSVRASKTATLIGLLLGIFGLAFALQPSSYLPFDIHPQLREMYVSALIPPYGRLPFPSSLCLFFVGVALALGGRQEPSFLTAVATLGAMVEAIGVASLLLFSSDFPQSTVWEKLDPSSPQSTVLYLALGLALFAFSARLAREEKPASLHWISIPAALGILVFSVTVWKALQIREDLRAENYLQQTVDQTRDKVVKMTEPELMPLLQNAKQWAVDGRPTAKGWQQEIRRALGSTSALQSVAWIDAKLEKRWAVNEQVNPLSDDVPADWSRTRDKLTAWGSRDKILLYLAGESGTFQVFVPLNSGRKFDGFLLGIYDTEKFFDAVFEDSYFEGLSVSVLDGHDELYATGLGISSEVAFAESSIGAFGLPWTLRLWANSPKAEQARSYLPQAVLALGVFLALIIGLLIHLAQAAWVQAHEVERANKELAESEEFLRKQSVELIEAREAALQASRMKSEFLANMSHEIRTPMNAIVGTVELMRDTKLNKDQVEYAKTIQEAAHSLLGLINDVLDFSKIEAGKMELEKIDFDPIGLVQSCADMFLHVARQKGIALTTYFAPSVPVIVNGDPGRLRQVLVNIIGNAVKFTEKGSVSVRVTSVPGAASKQLVKFSVVDTGVGISPEVGKKIFESFSQGDASTTRKYGGTGLGLAISRRLTEMMGGGIHLESEERKGSHFWFIIGFEPASQNADLSQEISQRVDEDDFHGTVLLVEDNGINREVARKLVAKMGYQVKAAASGREGLQALALEPFDVVLMDCQMPEMDGYECAARIREREIGTGKRIPIIALTAHALAGDRKRCLEAGMDDYLPKPFQPKVLSKLLSKWITKLRRDEKKVTATPAASPVQRTLADTILDKSVLKELQSLQKEDGTFVSRLVEMFRRQTPAILWRMRQARALEQWDEIARLAHSLKSASGNMAAGQMMQLCIRLEKAAREKDAANVAGRIAELEDSYRNTQRAWKGQLGKMITEDKAA